MEGRNEYIYEHSIKHLSEPSNIASLTYNRYGSNYGFTQLNLTEASDRIARCINCRVYTLPDHAWFVARSRWKLDLIKSLMLAPSYNGTTSNQTAPRISRHRLTNHWIALCLSAVPTKSKTLGNNRHHQAEAVKCWPPLPIRFPRLLWWSERTDDGIEVIITRGIRTATVGNGPGDRQVDETLATFEMMRTVRRGWSPITPAFDPTDRVKLANVLYYVTLNRIFVGGHSTVARGRPFCP